MLFLLASCGGGGGGSSSGDGELGALSVELAFTPGNENVTVNLVEKGPLVRLLNISSYQLTAVDSADEMMRVEGDRLAEGVFNGSVLRGLMNDHNYTFSLRVFYFPVGSAELSNLSLRIDYAEEANSENDRDAGGITIGSNLDGDHLANLVDADDDNDGLNDLDANGAVLDGCPRGELNWPRDHTTDIDGDGCRDAGEDEDDDNDEVGDLMDDCPRGELGWTSNGTTDNDGDGCRDADEDTDDDNDDVPDTEDLGRVGDTECRLSADCDGDTVPDNEDSGEFNSVKCYLLADCDGDTIADGADYGEYNGAPCRVKPDCDDDGEGDELDVDLDGDRLIELRTAADLNAVRYQLNGSGRRQSEGGLLNQTGCGDEAAITECNGYELVRDISLAIYAGGEGWAPLGRDTESSSDGCQGTAFGGIFDGNGFAVRELNISRIEEDCIGLFGHLAAGTVIRNLAVRAEAVIGRNLVGGLVGSGVNTEIVSTSLVAGEVRGIDNVAGGLVGSGANAKIVSSYSVAGGVWGRDRVGGLVGSGHGAEIVSSYSVAGGVRSDGGDRIGGLVGNGNDVEIVSSYSVAGEVQGRGGVGGLVGWGENAEMVSSSSVAGEVRSDGGDRVGGLVGRGDSARVVSSYSVAGGVWGRDGVGGLVGRSDSEGLVGSGTNAKVVSSYSVAGGVWGRDGVGGLVGFVGDIVYSYWHTAVLVAGDNTLGEEKTLAELQTPTNDNAYDMDRIYANWTRGADIDGVAGVENITIWCDEDLSGAIETAEMRDGSVADENDNRIWDFGGTNDYPAIRCLPLSLAEQRSWWFINGTGHPNVNRTRLDALTSP